MISTHFQDSLDVAQRVADSAEIKAAADAIADKIVNCLRIGGKVMFCGNGGSAAIAQHLAAELVGRYKRERPPFAAMSLTVDTSALTAIANDYGYSEVFARQLAALARRGDVLFVMSTSGRSQNVLYALEEARKCGVTTIGLFGRNSNPCDTIICVPCDDTALVQQAHLAIGHAIVAAVEEWMV